MPGPTTRTISTATFGSEYSGTTPYGDGTRSKQRSRRKKRCPVDDDPRYLPKTNIRSVDVIRRVWWAAATHNSEQLRAYFDDEENEFIISPLHINYSHPELEHGRTPLHMAVLPAMEPLESSEKKPFGSTLTVPGKDAEEQPQHAAEESGETDASVQEAENINVQLIQILLTHGADPTAVDDFGRTPMEYALERRLFRCFFLLLRSGGASASIRNPEISALLHQQGVVRNLAQDALSRGNDGLLELAVQAGMPPVTPDVYGNSLFHVCCRSGTATGMRVLLRNESVQAMDALCAALKAVNMDGDSPLHCLSQRAATDEEAHAILCAITERLPPLKRPASPDAATTKGGLSGSKKKPAKKGDSGSIDAIVIPEHEHPFMVLDKLQRTPIHRASLEGHSKLLEHFLELCPESVCQSVDGYDLTALQLAADRCHVDCVQVLAPTSTVERLWPDTGASILHRVIGLHEHSGDERTAMLVQTLLDATKRTVEPVHVELPEKAKGAKQSNRDATTPAPEELAQERAQLEEEAREARSRFVNAYDENGKTPLALCMEFGLVQTACILMDSGVANFEAVTKDGRNALFYACHFPSGDIVQSVLDRIPTSTKHSFLHRPDDSAVADGEFPIHVACRYGHANVVAALMNAGADINVNRRAKHSHPNTPLHTTASVGHARIIEMLIEGRADIMATVATTGETALHICAERGFVDCVQVLLRHGADPTVCDKRLRTCIMAAGDGGSPQCASAIIQFLAKKADSS